MHYVLASLDRVSSYEENDTKTTEFGWVVLILWSFLEQSFSNFVEFGQANGWGFTLCGHSDSLSLFCLDGSMDFPATMYERPQKALVKINKT